MIGTRRAAWQSYYYEDVLGTSLELRVLAASAADGRIAEETVLREIDRLDAILSGYAADSELSRWQATVNADVVISPDLAAVLDAAEVWRVRTHDAFNPAAAAIIDALKNGSPAKGDTTHVTEIIAALRTPLWRTDSSRGTARRLTTLSTSLDGLAKGYIVNRGATVARALPGTSAVMLNIGGDIQHVGDGGVEVGVADPFDPAENAPPIATIRIHDEALATSGGYCRGFRVNGEWHSHIVDPRTGTPSSRIVSASVVAPDCMTADVLSTALSVLAPEEGMHLVESLPGLGCLLIEADGRVSSSSRWNARAVGQVVSRPSVRTPETS